MSGTLPLRLYRGLTRLGAPLIARHIRRRGLQGKEDTARMGERFGDASLPRPEGRLLWVHAASVGESLSALPLVDAIRARHPGCSVLMTTGTVTSAALLVQRAKDVTHQYVPVDTPQAVGRFLDHWRPDAALWMESELWPTLITANAARSVPMALVNARLSKGSARNWGIAKRSAQAMLGAFKVRLAQTEEVRNRLGRLGVEAVVTGDLKASREPDPVDETALSALRDAIGDRPVWLAASTHPGDEAAVLDAHQALGIPGLLTVIAPRHPERGAQIATLAQERGYTVTRRSAGGLPSGDVYIADTLGELPILFALAPVALIGGGWDGIGGHNPQEAAPHGCAILSGADVPAFAETYARLAAEGAVIMLETRADLTPAMGGLLNDRGHRTEAAEAMGRAAFMAAGQPDPEPLRRTMAALGPLLDEAFA